VTTWKLEVNSVDEEGLAEERMTDNFHVVTGSCQFIHIVPKWLLAVKKPPQSLLVEMSPAEAAAASAPKTAEPAPAADAEAAVNAETAANAPVQLERRSASAPASASKVETASATGTASALLPPADAATAANVRRAEENASAPASASKVETASAMETASALLKLTNFSLQLNYSFVILVKLELLFLKINFRPTLSLFLSKID